MLFITMNNRETKDNYAVEMRKVIFSQREREKKFLEYSVVSCPWRRT